MTFIMGIDIGSATTKAVVLDDKKHIVVSEVMPTGANSRQSAQNVLNRMLSLNHWQRSQFSSIVATGYGRVSADFASKTITEITCHGFAAKWLQKKVDVIIDIGGQDSKAILVNEKGEVDDFVMNDKCAAGTGRFIELIAKTLEVSLVEVGSLSLKGKNPAFISSMCAVFAESEVVSLRAEGCDLHDILAGVHKAIARRVVSMAHRLNLHKKNICFTGGVAQNIGMKKALEEELGVKVIIPAQPQLVGALGAALLV
jgi:predicted CoA-substrate-specific enzyme activase